MGEIKESKGDVNEAIEYLERAADLYAGEEVKSTGNNCLLKARGGSARWRPCILAAGWSRPKLGAFWARSKPAAAGSRNPLEEPPLPICRLHPLAHPELPPPPQSAAPFPTFLPCVRPASATLAIPPSARPPVRASVRPVRLVVPHAVLSQTLCILSPSQCRLICLVAPLTLTLRASVGGSGRWPRYQRRSKTTRGRSSCSCR